MSQPINELGGNNPIWIVFCGGPKTGLWTMLQPDFKHCFGVIKTPHGWVVVDLVRGRLCVLTFPETPDFDLIKLLNDQRQVIVKTSYFNDEFPLISIAPWTCVAVIKRLLGLAAPTVFTPYQLYRALLKRGGQVVQAMSSSQGLNQPGENHAPLK